MCFRKWSKFSHFSSILKKSKQARENFNLSSFTNTLTEIHHWWGNKKILQNRKAYVKPLHPPLTPVFRHFYCVAFWLTSPSLVAFYGRYGVLGVKPNIYLWSAKSEDYRYGNIFARKRRFLKTVNFSSSFLTSSYHFFVAKIIWK